MVKVDQVDDADGWCGDVHTIKLSENTYTASGNDLKEPQDVELCVVACCW